MDTYWRERWNEKEAPRWAVRRRVALLRHEFVWLHCKQIHQFLFCCIYDKIAAPRIQGLVVLIAVTTGNHRCRQTATSILRIIYSFFKVFAWFSTSGRMFQEALYKASWEDWEKVWMSVCLKETMFVIFWLRGHRNLFWSVKQIWIIHSSPNIGGTFK